MKNLFDKYFGKCFSGYCGKPSLNPTLGLTIQLSKCANGNAVPRKLPNLSPNFKTVNKSRYLRYGR